MSWKFRLVATSLACLVGWMSCSTAIGQDRGERGGRGGSRGGFGGRGGFERGGFGGPGGGFRGGPGGRGGFDPTAILRRFDRNGNGVLEPSESQGPARFFLERITQRLPDVNLEKPIKIERLVQDLTGSRSSRESAEDPTLEPLVPGFGGEEELALPPGFGAAGELFAIRVLEEDRREAEERFRRYDRDGDGNLDRRELSRGRWRDDPFVYDRNGDGKLSVGEMAVRYARRRMEEAEEEQTSDGRGGGDGGREGGEGRGRRGGRGGEDWFSRMQRMRGGGGGGGFPFGGFRGGGNRSRDAEEEEPADEPEEADPVPTIRSYRFQSAEELLPDGLPSWFQRLDQNGDGQIAMAEYAGDWSNEAIREFGTFDLNRDGLVTAPECLQAVDRGAVRRTSSVGRRNAPPPAVTTSGSASASSSAGSGDKILNYANGLMKKLDANGNGFLTASEWQSSKSIARAATSIDADGDGKIELQELADFYRPKK